MKIISIFSIMMTLSVNASRTLSYTWAPQRVDFTNMPAMVFECTYVNISAIEQNVTLLVRAQANPFPNNSVHPASSNIQTVQFKLKNDESYTLNWCHSGCIAGSPVLTPSFFKIVVSEDRGALIGDCHLYIDDLGSRLYQHPIPINGGRPF